MTVVRTFSPFLQGSRRWLAASVATAVLQAGLLVLVGLLVRRAFDHSIPEEDVRELALVGLALLALALVAGASAVWTRYLVLRAVKDAVARLRIAVLERLNTLPRAWYDRADAETLHATVVQDTERLDVVATAVASQLAPAVVIGTGLGVALLVIDPLLFAIVAVVLPVLAVLTRRFDGVVRRRTRDWQHAFDRFSARVHLAVRGRPLIAAQAAEDVELDAARNEILDLSDAGRQMAWLHAVYAQLHSAVAALSGVVVLVVGGAAVADGRMSLGSLISFSTLLALLRAQGNTALATIPQAISGRESLARIQEILDAPEREPYRGRRKPTIERSLTLRDVHFGYRSEVPVLRGLSLEVERGEHVTLVGANGAGKTTVVSLVLGLYRPWRGTLEADGVPYDELDVRALRRRIGFVPQRPILLPGIGRREHRLRRRHTDGAEHPRGGTDRHGRRCRRGPRRRLRHARRRGRRSPRGRRAAAARDRARARPGAGAPDPRRADDEPRPRRGGASRGELQGASARPGGAPRLARPGGDRGRRSSRRPRRRRRLRAGARGAAAPLTGQRARRTPRSAYVRAQLGIGGDPPSVVVSAGGERRHRARLRGAIRPRAVTGGAGGEEEPR